MKKHYVIWLIITTLLSACNGSDKSEESRHRQLPMRELSAMSTADAIDPGYRHTTDIPDPSPDPIKKALEILHLQPADLIRPLSYEEGYNLMAFMPRVDQVMASPFYLQQWADETSQKLQEYSVKSLEKTLAVSLEAINAGATKNQYSSEIKEGIDFTQAYRHLCRKFAVKPESDFRQKLKHAGFSAVFDRQLGMLTWALTDAAVLAMRAYSGLNADEMITLCSRPERYFYPHDRYFRFLTAPTHEQVKLVALARKIRYEDLFAAAHIICRALDGFTEYIRNLGTTSTRPEAFFPEGFGSATGTVLSLSTPIGDIVVLGPDDNDYSGSGALVVDLGGNDHYTGPIGVGHLSAGRLAIAIDTAGNDTYDSSDQTFAQGVGIASIGAVVDLDGEDRYRAGHMSQGCGIYGIGILSDFHGDDTYHMGLMGQGFGTFGVGVMIDRDGNDSYQILGMGQGAGSTMGFGGLFDHSGNDIYRADRNLGKGDLIPDEWCHAQGTGFSVRSPDWRNNFSLYGGVGFLSDGSGSDQYYCSNGNCMGAGYFMSIGALVDHGGDDRYEPKNGNGMGFAVHLAAGVLIDRTGNDIYFAKNDSGGVGADRSVGMLIDYQGNDLYGPPPPAPSRPSPKIKAGTVAAQTNVLKTSEAGLAITSYASASRPKGMGFLLDYAGNDRYYARSGVRSASMGEVIPPAQQRDWGYALLVDFAGDDLYHAEGGRNNSYTNFMNHGISYDAEHPTEYFVQYPPLEWSRPLPAAQITLPQTVEDRPFAPLITKLMTKNNFERFSAVGQLMRADPEIIQDLIGTLLLSNDAELNAGLIEGLNHFILNGYMNARRSRDFEALLGAQDPSVRIYAARTLGWWGVKSSLSTIVEGIAQTNPDVRSQIIWALGRLGGKEQVLQLTEAVRSDPAPNCRRAAAQAVKELLESKPEGIDATFEHIRPVLVAWLDAEDPILRADAAASLAYVGRGNAAVDALSRGLEDADVYVRRACARTLILMGEKKGIPVLIETLNFPSIDTYEHYDEELTKYLAFYCGVDFSRDKRYAYRTWKDWWGKNGEKVNLSENLSIMHAIENARAARDEKQGIRLFDRLSAAHPGNVVIKNRFIRYCRDWITYGLLSQDAITLDILNRCLQLQRKLVELDPENVEMHVTLANFYARLKDFDAAVTAIQAALKMAPRNPRYNEALDRYQALAKASPEKSNGKAATAEAH